MTLAAGTRLGPYEISSPLGAGGMGEVYRARDTRLDRDVALKVLPAEMAGDPDRLERFRREAKALAALDHPGVVSVHSVEEADGLHFLTMQLVEGQSLDRLIPSAGMPIDRILAIASGLADALVAAHARGIVHRDLKPANVMITADGRVKVLDFGLAKFAELDPSGAPTVTHVLTNSGVIMGTVPYMSPEQVSGRPVDQRSDIFSFGVTLYEMVTGRRPFQAASSAELASQILRDTPRPLADLRRSLPAGLDVLVERCLEKRAENRFTSAGELAGALRAVRRSLQPGTAAPAAAPAGNDRTIVVLPFANSSADPENEFFSDGLTEEIISDLSKIRALRVISRTSSMQLKGARKDLRTIARELGVRYVLEGSVRKAGSSLRITAQLADASADASLWSEKYSGTLDDVFEVQERVSREIVRALDITLTSDEHRRLAERPIANARAFELFLQARTELRRYAPARAEALLREAVRVEGASPTLTSQLTWVKVMRVRAGMSRDRSLLDEAEREARELLERVPEAGFGHSLLGQIEYERGRLVEAVRHCKLALAREPNDSDTLVYLGMAYVAAARYGEAFATVRRMVACDPLSPLSWLSAGTAPSFEGRPADGIPDLEHALELDPNNLMVHWGSGYVYAQLGRLDDARRHARALEAILPEGPYTRQAFSLIDGLEGRTEEALARITGIDPAPLDAHHRFHLAESFIVAGEHDRGLDLLEQSVSGFYPYPYLSEHCRFLNPVRGTARFSAYLEAARRHAEAFREHEP
jgi:serine/threonine protein kinase/Flp pilus assembly protein TadD